MSYMDFMTRFRQVFKQGTHPVYHDLKQPRPRMYQEYRPGNRALLYWRNPHLTDKEDCCLHFLMLYMPTRVHTDQWLQMTPAQSMFELARAFFGDNRLQTLVPGILDGATAQLVALGGQQEQQQPEQQPIEQLSTAQKALIDAIVTGPRPFVVTRAAGTGKSTILMSLVH
ncbi:hypothetical protein BGX24_006475 [Mortierella sp. AD032]|nr:hypothetical protein BGX24_006475 [Mortierella sp. AD032]